MIQRKADNAGQAVDTVSERMMLASRYSDFLRRLSFSVARLGMRDRGQRLLEISNCLERLAFDLATAECGGIILGRAARLIAAIERRVAKMERKAVLH